MKTNCKRTTLGNITYGLLTASVVLFLLSMILPFIALLIPLMNETSVSGVGIILILSLLLMGAIFLIYYKYWNAFRLNEPQRIKGVSIVLLILSVIAFLTLLWMMMLYNSYAIDSVTESSSKYLWVSVLSMAMFIILLVELKFQANKQSGIMSYAWIVVGVITIATFILNTTSGQKDESIFSKILSILLTLSFDAGLVLISCWITNQSKFYESENTDNE